jgi:recombination protein RecR
VYEGVVQNLIDELGRLPGVGPKGAQRIAFHLLQADPADVQRLVQTLTEVKARVRFCVTCGNVAEQEQCRVCRDPRRDPAVLCVVEEPKDVVAVERTREFRGRYHVLGGAISPIEGVGPGDLRIRELLTRLADGVVDEVIIATDPNLEGEATARRGHPGQGLRGTPSRRCLTRRRACLAVQPAADVVDNVRVSASCRVRGRHERDE